MASAKRKEIALPPDAIPEGAVLARSVMDYSVPGGSTLLKKGTVIGSEEKVLLKSKSISNVFIHPESEKSSGDWQIQGSGAERAVDPETGTLRIDSEKAADLHADVVSFATTMLTSVIQNDNLDFVQLSNTVSLMQKQIRENEAAMVSLAHLKDVDSYTFMHSVNVSVLSLLLGERAGLPEKELHDLGTGAILHDIGKLVVDQTVLNKPGRLTDEEFREIKNHAQKGYLLLRDRGIDEDISRIALTHHEKINGRGYPSGLPETNSL